MPSSQIVVLWPSGNVVCVGESTLHAPPAQTPVQTPMQTPMRTPMRTPMQTDEAPETEPCPPTKRSPHGESGVFRRDARAA